VTLELDLLAMNVWQVEDYCKLSWCVKEGNWGKDFFRV
jgi:hypothetical protein